MSRERKQLEKQKLTEDEVAALRQRVAVLEPVSLESRYLAVVNACRSIKHLPSPATIQELVQLWKELYRRRHTG